MDEKQFPPRKAYSLKEAADRLGCTIEDIIDWGWQGYVDICLKVTNHLDMEIPEFYDGYSKDFSKVDFSTCNAMVTFDADDDQFVGYEEEYFAFYPRHLFEHWEKNPKRKKGICWGGDIYGFWKIDKGHLYDIKDNDVCRFGLKSYSDNVKVRAETMVAFSFDDLYLPLPEYKKLSSFDPSKSELDQFLSTVTVPDKEISDKELNHKSLSSHLNIIGALFEELQKEKKKENQDVTKTSIIESLAELYTGYTGLSLSNLKSKIPEAIRRIQKP